MLKLQEQTKALIAEALKKQMKRKPFENIRIQDICDACGASRRTFYNHFHDKYDLVAWIYAYTVEKHLFSYPSYDFIKKATPLYEDFRNNLEFYRNVFHDKSQNALGDYMVEYNYKLFVEMLKRWNPYIEQDEGALFSIRMYSYGCCGITIEWVFQKANLPPELMAKRLYENLPQIMKEYFQISMETFGEHPRPWNSDKNSLDVFHKE